MDAKNTHDDTPLSDEQGEFLTIALGRLDTMERTHMAGLPAAVGSSAATAAFNTITNCAVSGVESFRDERGRQCRPKIHAYVRAVVEPKIKGAYSTEKAIPLDHERMATLRGDIRGFDVRELLEHEAELDSERAAAEARCDVERERAGERDVERLNWIMEMLVVHGIKGHDATLVMLRAMRRWTLDVTEEGLRINYVEAMPLPDVAERIGASHGAARARSSRTMRRFPRKVAWLIRHPEAFQPTEFRSDDGPAI